MREIIWLNSALDDLIRLREFITNANSQAAKKAAQAIKDAVIKLKELPHIGKPVEDLPNYRDLYIKFGAAGYMMRYRIHQDDVYVVHLRHYRELDFASE